MMKKWPLIACLLLFTVSASAQCLDNIQVEESNSSGYEYLYACPCYLFSYNGDTSRHWKVFGNNIDYGQLPAGVKALKNKTDRFVKDYSGNAFFSKVSFEQVAVVYPDSLQAFKELYASMDDCKAKYVFFYRYRFDSLASMVFGVAINNAGRVIRKNMIPSKAEFKPFDRAFNYCKLIDIAKRKKKDIEPIESIRLEYSITSKRFYWRVMETNRNKHLGRGYIYSVLVDAADMSRSRVERSTVFSEE